METLVSLTKSQFEAYLDGAVVEVRNEAGVSYRTRDGRLVAEVYDGVEWEYLLLNEVLQ